MFVVGGGAGAAVESNNVKRKPGRWRCALYLPQPFCFVLPKYTNSKLTANKVTRTAKRGVIVTPPTQNALPPTAPPIIVLWN